MKLCLICGAKSPDTAATCPNCGHASWQLLAKSEPKPVAEPDERPARNLRGKRGKR